MKGRGGMAPGLHGQDSQKDAQQIILKNKHQKMTEKAYIEYTGKVQET